MYGGWWSTVLVGAVNMNNCVLTKQQRALLHAYHNLSCEYCSCTVIQSSTEFILMTSSCSYWKAVDWRQHLVRNEHKWHIYNKNSYLLNGKFDYFLLRLDVLNITFIIQKGCWSSKFSNTYEYSAYDRRPFNQQR
jgi:hypothetical protein